MKSCPQAPLHSTLLSLPVREVWIEIPKAQNDTKQFWSLPVREVWIEITCPLVLAHPASVTSREGSVTVWEIVMFVRVESNRL